MPDYGLNLLEIDEVHVEKSSLVSSKAIGWLLAGAVVILLSTANIYLYLSNRSLANEIPGLEKQMAERELRWKERNEYRYLIDLSDYHWGVNQQIVQLLAPGKQYLDFSVLTPEVLNELSSNLLMLPLDRESLNSYQLAGVAGFRSLLNSPSADLGKHKAPPNWNRYQNGLAVCSRLPGEIEAAVIVDRYQYREEENAEEAIAAIIPPALVESTEFPFHIDAQDYYFVVAVQKVGSDGEIVIDLAKPDERMLELGRYTIPEPASLSQVNMYHPLSDLFREVGRPSMPVPPRFSQVNMHHSDLFREQKRVASGAKTLNLLEPNQNGIWLDVFLPNATTPYLNTDWKLEFVTVRLVIRRKQEQQASSPLKASDHGDQESP